MHAAGASYNGRAIIQLPLYQSNNEAVEVAQGPFWLLTEFDSFDSFDSFETFIADAREETEFVV